jgi:hypothetical protein
MSELSFQASTQYGDWKGTAAADEYGGGGSSFEEVFEATGKVDKDNEVLIGFEFYAGEGFFFLHGITTRRVKALIKEAVSRR